MTMSKRKYLFWVEDEAYAKEGFGRMLSAGSFEILGPYSNQEDAIKVFDEKQEEVLVALIDLWVPRNDNENIESPQIGYQIAKIIKNKGVPVVLLTARVDAISDILYDAIQSQISVLIKGDVKEHIIIQSIEMAISGCGVYSRQAFGELSRQVAQKSFEDPLSQEQWTLLEARISGNSIRQIAEQKKYAISTISNKFTEIYQKLGVPNQIEAIRWYQKNAKRFGRNFEE